MILTYQYRIKDSTSKIILNRMASKVNYVFNYCNETSIKAIKRDYRFLSGFDLSNLVSGSSKELGLHSQTLQVICEEYALRRKQFKKIRLNWRTYKRHTGWIPFKKVGIKIIEDTATYCKHTFRFWKSRSIPKNGEIRSGSFTSDRRGRWYVNLQVKLPDPQKFEGNQVPVGIDLGLKTHMSLSDGTKYEYPKYYRQYEEKLGIVQRAKKRNQIKAISAKIANRRKDWLHKVTTKIVDTYSAIFIGNVSSSKLAKTNMAKSVLDSGWFKAKTFFGYKSLKLGKVFKEKNEYRSSCTCSVCLAKTGPSGLSQLDIRKWMCSNCNSIHDRDTNAALNILHFPSRTLEAVQESPA